ncbi:MAG: TIGR03032 family protein [Pirellulaceae bacterium]|jgi:uncharacterized protein (TIGR03032 family)|nr:TIGR03032 family protein [Pirellulaceae bacterium]
MDALETLAAGTIAGGTAAGHFAERRRTPPALPAPVEFRYTQTDSFVALLHELRSSLFVSTYQANKLLAVRASGRGLSTLVRTFERPMGLAVDGSRLTLGTQKEVWFLRNAPDIAPRIEPAGTHDACFLPRASHVTGDIGIHEIARSGDELWLVSTRFSCLATLSPEYSFVPRWRPPFISALTAEDRCHLNGLAMVAGKPQFVSALGTTDTRDGWRADKPQGGCIIDVASGEFVTRGLSMPHSPRWHDGQLWVLQSGTGSLSLVDHATGHHETVIELPGFTRGLAFVGPIALIGLSKIRPTSAMDGVPIADRQVTLKCGVAAVDLRSGRLVGLLEFQTAVEEIFDVQLLPGIRFPEVMGFQKESLHHTFIIPPT